MTDEPRNDDGAIRVLLVNQYFWPDVAATAQLLSDLAEDLVRRGVKVCALSGRARYARMDTRHGRRAEDWQGIQIRRVWTTNFGRSNTVGRLADYLSFLLSATWGTLRWGLRYGEPTRPGPPGPIAGERSNKVHSGRPRNVVVCLSTPPLIAIVGAMARLFGCRFIYKVEDLYPDVAIALGVLSSRGVVSRCLAAVSRFLLRSADAVVVLDKAMESRIRERRANRTYVIPNWSNTSRVDPMDPSVVEFRRVNRLEGRFVVLYSGNLGLAHCFEEIVAAATILATTVPQVLFLFVGDGPRLAAVRADSAGLPNVSFLPYQPREALPTLYAVSDVHLISLRRGIGGLLTPSKYPAALGAGKPVLLVGGIGCDLYDEVRIQHVGWTCGHDPGAVVAAVTEATRFPGDVSIRSENARRLFARKYSREICTSHWHALLTAEREHATSPT